MDRDEGRKVVGNDRRATRARRVWLVAKPVTMTEAPLTNFAARAPNYPFASVLSSLLFSVMLTITITA